MSRLSTHVLDTSRGVPAVELRVRLFACDGDSRRLLETVKTNADGRAIMADSLPSGVYELVFSAGEYFGGDRLPFLGDVLVRFGLNAEQGNYHVPLLLSPYGYTTYRGS